MDRRRAAGALLALTACIATTAAAPTYSNQTALDLYDAATEGCYYNFQHYGEGDRIMTNEPCLNCTCHNRMLMCYLRVCPFTKPIGQDCTVEKRADQCCPIVTCPDVPVDLLTSTSTSSPAEYGATGVGKLDKYGCSINGKYFSEGSKVPPTPNKPCEHCYCIRNMTTCVMQECTLHVDGCTPIYHKDVCCPVRYSCDHLEDEILGLDDMSTTVRPTPGFLLTTTTESPVTQVTQDCVHNDQVFADGTSIKTEKACEHCYCMKGDIVCVVQECGTPMENEGKNCTSQPPREGQCCPDTYICEGDELTTELPSDLSTQPLLEELTTVSPPKRTEDEGSGYRNEPDESPHSETPVVEPDVEGSGDELVTMQPLDVSEKYTSSLIDDTFASTEDQGLDATKSSIEDERTTIQPDSELNTVPSGVSEPSVPKLTTLTEEMKSSDEQEKDTTYYEYSTTPLDSLRTTKESALHTTESSFRKEDDLHAPTDISTLEPVPTKEIHEEKLELKPIVEDDTKITKPSLSDDTQTTTELSTSSDSEFSKSDQSSEHTITEQTTLVIPEKIETTTLNAYENEIEDNSTPQSAGRIPGEGDCLQGGITYRNDSSVPSTNNCQTDCKCISSIIKCDPIICSPPPEYMSNCVPTYDSSESCCPTYVCDGSKETLPPQPHSQMSETESSTLTPTIECHDDQCEVQDNKSSPIPVCTSEDCLIKPGERPQTSDCESCKGVEEEAIQPDMQTDCGSTGCGEKIEITHHEPSSVLPMVPEICIDAECKQKVTPCEGENCKISSTEECQNEEDCKNIQHILKNDTSCEGDACKEVPVDCGATSCDVSPPIQQVPDICSGADCKKLEEPALECTDDNCRRVDTADVGGKIPADCTDSNCAQQKPETPELSVTETVSLSPEKIPGISAMPELQNEVTLSPETTLDQESGIQTEQLHEVGTKVPQTATDDSATESSTDISKATEVATNIPELTPEEVTTSEPQTVEIKQTSELPTTVLHGTTTEFSDTKIMIAQPQDEAMPIDKITTIPQPTLAESQTLSEHETVKDVTELSTTMASKDHKEESYLSTEVVDFVTKVPDIITSEPYDHSTQIQEEIITKQEDDQLVKDTEHTTASSIKDTDSDKHTDQELITKSPMLVTETTAIILEKVSLSTAPTPQSETTDKTKLPDIPEIYITTESSIQYPSDTQSSSDTEEKSSTEYPSIPEEKTEVIMETADMTHSSDVTSPSILDEKMTTKSSEMTEFIYESQTTLSSKESEFTKVQEVYTEKPDIHELELSTTTSPELHITDEVSDQPTTIKEKESIDISREPEKEREEQHTTMTPLTSLEAEIETEIPTSVTDLNVPIKTEAPPTLDEVSKENLPKEVEHEVSTEPQEIYTEEPFISEEPSITEEPPIPEGPSISKEPFIPEEPFISEEPSVTEREEFSQEPSLKPELPDYIPVHPSTIEEKDKLEKPGEEIPISEVTTESKPEYISSTTQRLEIETQEPDEITQTYMTTTGIPEFDKSDESTQSPYSKPIDSDDTDAHTERQPAITSTEEHEMATESEQFGTEEEDILKATEAPESFVKDAEEKITTTIPDITDTSEAQAPIDKIQTEPQVIVMPESSVSEPPLPEPGKEEDLSTKTQKPEVLKETATKTSDQTTEQYDHSETLPDMIELVEHHPMTDISTISSISDEITTVSSIKHTTMYTDIQEVDKEHKLDDTLTTIKPFVSDMDHKPTQDETEIGTESVTRDYEPTFDGEVSTKRPDNIEVDDAVTTDEKVQTERTEKPALEQSFIPDEETITEKIDISDIEPEIIPVLGTSTEKSEIAENGQEIMIEEKPQTEKPETPITDIDTMRPEESPTEKDKEAEPESITKETELHVEPSEMPEIETEKETTMETPAAVTAFDDSLVEPETSTSRQEVTSKSSEVDQEIVHTTKDSEVSVTEYVIPDQEIVTKSEVEEESASEKATSTEKISDMEHEATSETDIGAGDIESSTTETKLISSQESVTVTPESIGIESYTKPDRNLTTSTEELEPSKTEQDMKPDEEPAITIPDTVDTRVEVKPDEKFSTIKPETLETEDKRKPDKEPINIPEAPLVEQTLKPDMELSTEQQETSDVEEGPKIDLGTKETTTIIPESGIYETPKEHLETPTTDLISSQEPVTSEGPESNIKELETMPEGPTEKTEISVSHEGSPEQDSMTKEPESTIIDHEPTTSSEIEDKETPHKEATERPQTTETLPETLPEQESATLKPELPVTDQVLSQDSTTSEPEAPELETDIKHDKEYSTESSDSEKEISTEAPEKPDIQLQSSTKEPEIPEIEPQHSTKPSEVPEIEPQSSTERSELAELEPQHSTEPSEILDIRLQSSTVPSEISEIESQSSTEQAEIPEIEPQSTTVRSEEPEVEPHSSTERLSEPEIEPISSTERLEVPEIKPQTSTERSELPELEPQYSTESSEILDVKPQSPTEPSEIFEVQPQSSTERAEMPDIEPQSSSESSEMPDIELQPFTEQTKLPEIELQASTEPSDIPDTEHEIKLTEAPESEVYKEPSTEKVEPEKEMEPITESIKPLEPGDEIKPGTEFSTEPSEVPEIEHEIELSTERSETSEIEHEKKPSTGSSTEGTEATEYESKEPETSVTEHDVTDLQTSTRLPETFEAEHEIKPDSDSFTELYQAPETTDRATSILPSEEHTKSKPIEEEILVRTTTEIPSSVIYESTTTVDKVLPEKSTEPSVPAEHTTLFISSSYSPEVHEDTEKQDHDLTTLSTTSKYPLKEEPTTAVISETEKLPPPKTEIPVQTEHDTEKPTESKDTTAPEEEFLAVTTKPTTPKIEVKPTQPSSYDKFTKPHGTPESELMPSSVAPEIPKPGINEVQATDEISPEEDGHFAPSATGGYGGQETDYEDENQPFGPGTCRYGGKVYVSAQQIPRDDPCDFCFCFRSDIICLQQSCPPPIHGCHEEPIQGFCCPRYECPVSMASTLNITTTTTTTTTTLPPHFNLNAYQGAAQRRGCQIKGHTYKVGEVVRASSGPCLHCTCGGDGQMKCDPKACTPEPMLRQMIAAAVSAKRRR